MFPGEEAPGLHQHKRKGAGEGVSAESLPGGDLEENSNVLVGKALGFLLVKNRKPPCLRGGRQVPGDVSLLILGYPLHGIDNVNTANCGPVSCSRCKHFAGLSP